MAAAIIPLHDRPAGGPASPGRTHPGRTDDARVDAVRPLGDSLLSRHRRLVAAVLALVVAVGMARSAPDVAAWLAGDPPPSPPAEITYVVQPGDSLWSIARQLEPHGDIRPLVDRLVEINGGAGLRAGDTLVLQW